MTAPNSMTEFESGAAALGGLAPELMSVLDGLESALWRDMAAMHRLDLIDRVCHAIGDALGLPPLERPIDRGASSWNELRGAGGSEVEGLSDDEAIALRFARQMSFHVGSLTEHERTDYLAALGADAPIFTQAVFVADLLPRARGALDALFGPSTAREWAVHRTSSEASNAADLSFAIGELIRVVPGRVALDPVTTELVRLLGARFHRCRICQSLRSRSAMVAGADDATFDAVDHYSTSDLPAAQKAALAFAEAMLVAPGQLSGELGAELLRYFEPVACVELVLDVTRNATNKVAVALAADGPRVEVGYEVYDVTPDGEIHYGLEAP